eukprot:GHVS01073277.1.p1 GENE.GHVS01073277.1~~GHVS01073277.1.p1  ORF type:complete len:167 (+),score=6.58 GHVS01073277.1:329-829(+)
MRRRTRICFVKEVCICTFVYMYVRLHVLFFTCMYVYMFCFLHVSICTCLVLYRFVCVHQLLNVHIPDQSIRLMFMYYVYVLCVCVLCMSCLPALYRCVVCMYYVDHMCKQTPCTHTRIYTQNTVSLTFFLTEETHQLLNVSSEGDSLLLWLSFHFFSVAEEEENVE